MARKVARKKTALAVGAIAACVLPGALAGSSAPPNFPKDCIKQATLGKCLAGDKLFGDKPDHEAMEAMKDLLSEPLTSGPEDEPTLGGGIKKFVRHAAGKPTSAMKKAALKKAALKKAALKKADAATDDTKLDAPKTLDDNDAQDDNDDMSTHDMTHTADDSHHEYPSDMSADEHAADEHAAEEESMRDKMSSMKAGFQGCDLSVIAQCMIDSGAPEAQAKGNEIKHMIASPMWKSAPVECSYPTASGSKPSCEHFMEKEAKLAVGRAPRRAQLGAELAQGQAGAAYVAVIASVAAFAGYTVYQRRQQYESVPTNAGYGAM